MRKLVSTYGSSHELIERSQKSFYCEKMLSKAVEAVSETGVLLEWSNSTKPQLLTLKRTMLNTLMEKQSTI